MSQILLCMLLSLNAHPTDMPAGDTAEMASSLGDSARSIKALEAENAQLRKHVARLERGARVCEVT